MNRLSAMISTFQAFGRRKLKERIAFTDSFAAACRCVSLAVLLTAALAGFVACVRTDGAQAAIADPPPVASQAPAAAADTAPPIASAPSRSPFNTAQSAERYALLSPSEQMACYPLGALAQRSEDNGYAAEDAAAARGFILDFFKSSGIMLPQDATVDGSDQYGPWDGAQDSGSTSTAQCYLTKIASAQSADDGDPWASIVAVAFELAEGSVGGGNGTQSLPQHLSRILLRPSSPSRAESFCYDSDSDGTAEYYVGFWRYEGDQAVYPECFRLTRSGDAFLAEKIDGALFLARRRSYEDASSEANMRIQIVQSGGYGYTVVPLEDLRGRMRAGRVVLRDYYMSVSHTQSATLTIAYSYEEARRKSLWRLTLDWPEGETLHGSLAADGAYDTFFCTQRWVDLTGDGKEEFILFLTPQNADQGLGSELHVFSERDGELAEILRLYDGDPSRSTLAIPEQFRELNEGADTGSFGQLCRQVDVVSCGGLHLLRIGGDLGQSTARTYLWYNRQGEWEIVDQTVQSS